MQMQNLTEHGGPAASHLQFPTWQQISKKWPPDKDQVKDRLDGPLFKLQVFGPGLAKGLLRIVGHCPRKPASPSKRGAHLKEPTMNANRVGEELKTCPCGKVEITEYQETKPEQKAALTVGSISSAGLQGSVWRFWGAGNTALSVCTALNNKKAERRQTRACSHANRAWEGRSRAPAAAVSGWQ